MLVQMVDRLGQGSRVSHECPTENTTMPGRSYLIFGDIEGKLDVLRVECTKVRPQGPLQRLKAHREIRAQGKHDEMEQLNGDCPRRDEHSLHERCDLICPDLPKVL